MNSNEANKMLLGGNKITDRGGMKILNSIFESNKKTLKVLDLSNNP